MTPVRKISIVETDNHKFDVSFIYTIEDQDFPKMYQPSSVMKYHIIVNDNKFYPSDTFSDDAIASFDDLEAMCNGLDQFRALRYI
jgi:hypothetical protein